MVPPRTGYLPANFTGRNRIWDNDNPYLHPRYRKKQREINLRFAPGDSLSLRIGSTLRPAEDAPTLFFPCRHPFDCIRVLLPHLFFRTVDHNNGIFFFLPIFLIWGRTLLDIQFGFGYLCNSGNHNFESVA
jgi:hypothetical protein